MSEIRVIERLIDKSTCDEIIAEIKASPVKLVWNKRYMEYMGGDLNNKSFNIGTDTKTFCPRASHKALIKINQFVTENYPDMFIQKAFVVMYDAASPNHNELHVDTLSDVTLVLNLNDDFVGGGTYLDSHKMTYAPPAGSIVCFPSTEIHCGMYVESGMRYVITYWLRNHKFL